VTVCCGFPAYFLVADACPSMWLLQLAETAFDLHELLRELTGIANVVNWLNYSNTSPTPDFMFLSTFQEGVLSISLDNIIHISIF
jgi:hypothetical protein